MLGSCNKIIAIGRCPGKPGMVLEKKKAEKLGVDRMAVPKRLSLELAQKA